MIYLKAVILAVVEGITEFLPISSTGHLILVEEVLSLSDDPEFSSAFNIIIQLPAILSVVVYFWKDLWPYGASDGHRRELHLLWAKILLAVTPALVIGFLVGDFLDEHLFAPLPVAIALLAGGVFLIAIERLRHRVSFESVRDITFQAALLIGFIQCLAMFPGTSRSAATIIGAMLLGASRPAAVEFSFFLAIPTMMAATAYLLVQSGFTFTGQQWAVLAVGSVASFVVAYAVIAGFMHYVRTRSFALFGYYRIGLALLVFAAWQLGWITAGN